VRVILHVDDVEHLDLYDMVKIVPPAMESQYLKKKGDIVGYAVGNYYYTVYRNKDSLAIRKSA
jgi:hypothetical protein